MLSPLSTLYCRSFASYAGCKLWSDWHLQSGKGDPHRLTDHGTQPVLAWLRNCIGKIIWGKSTKLKDLLHLGVAKNVLDRYTYHSEHYIWVKQSLQHDTLNPSCCQVHLLLLLCQYTNVVHGYKSKLLQRSSCVKCVLLNACG